MDRTAALKAIAGKWAQFDPARHPFVRNVATQLPEHDDRDKFVAGVETLRDASHGQSRPVMSGAQ
ncbi:hypothetical protein [Novosphingobium sp. P6W]|uniref:hypothetical protein n=1 Tax=Novosphingobium sp. P6W TaxID=1609758 RepID=UPI0005C2ABBB|nr:hypothetical protein [Novosphingobium sp. P6W]AXB78850.1 hypothetical protein TQ38_019880 [Novosphingobium sp. P6W]KIS30160.1 hypothetical protein TQ38_24365 [Novosphingobium sp. P6W]